MNELLKKDQSKLGLLHYEVQMFRCMYECLKLDEKLFRGLQNAILESYLVHVRNLIEFFQGTINQPPYKKVCSDIIISDFKDKNGNDLHLVQKKDWKITSQDKKKINTFLNHLSEERLNENKVWREEIDRFKIEVGGQVEKFLQDVSDEYFPFQKDKKQIKKTNFGEYEEAFCNYITKIENEIGKSKSRFKGFASTTSDF